MQMKILQVLMAVLVTAIVISRFMQGRRGVADADAAVFEQLRSHGSDLTKSHNVEFFIYLPSEGAANRAVSQIGALGFGTEVSPPPEGHTTWCCRATKPMVPNLETIREMGRSFTQIAESLGGKYDGWGTPIVE